MIFVRRLFSILFSVAWVFSITSCSEDEDLTPNPAFSQTVNLSKSTLVGTWEMNSLNYSGTSTANSITTSFKGVGLDFDFIMEIKDNPPKYTQSGGYTVELTSTFDSLPAFTNIVPVDVGEVSGNWELKNSEFITVDDSTQFESSSLITDFTSNSFTMDFSDMLSVNSGQGPVEINLSSAIATFKRKK